MKKNESADSFYINSQNVRYTRSDAVSFVIFSNGFTVYSTAGVEDSKPPDSLDSGHIALATAWRLKYMVDEGMELNHREKELWSFYKDHIKTHGEMDSKALRGVRGFVSGQETPYDWYGSSNMLKGRVWRGTGIVKHTNDSNEPKTDKVVAFWNRNDDIKSMSAYVVNLIELLGEDPKEYNYELRDEDYGHAYYSYHQFLDIPEDTTDYNKEYKIGGSLLKYSDFEDLRTTMHTGGPIKGQQAKEKLCRILTKEFIEKNPELRGFVPPDCAGVASSYDTFKSKGWRDYTRDEIERGLAPSRDILRRKIGASQAKRDIKSFYKGQGAEPVLPTTFEPGQAAGMRGRTLGGFRSRTQKEIDAAWDDFMKKRESTDAKEIKFKEWFVFLEQYFEKKNLILEDPNEVSRNPRTNRPKLTFADSFAITFILFKDYFVYAPSFKGVMHDNLAQWLSFMVTAHEKYLSYFEKINYWTKEIREIGNVSDKDIETIKDVAWELQLGVDGRNAFLRTNPEVILGRLWTRQKVVSFWNHLPYVTKASDSITKFVSKFGNPSEFEYDVRNVEVSYKDIIEKNNTPNFENK